MVIPWRQYSSVVQFVHPTTASNLKRFSYCVTCKYIFVIKNTLFCSSQEGWRLEQTDLSDPSSPIIFKGVVYNEMKGVFVSNYFFSFFLHFDMFIPIDFQCSSVTEFRKDIYFISARVVNSNFKIHFKSYCLLHFCLLKYVIFKDYIFLSFFS